MYESTRRGRQYTHKVNIIFFGGTYQSPKLTFQFYYIHKNGNLNGSHITLQFTVKFVSELRQTAYDNDGDGPF